MQSFDASTTEVKKKRSGKTWHSEVEQVMVTPMNAIFSRTRGPIQDFAVNLEVIVSHDVAGLPQSKELKRELRDADLHHPKPRAVETRPYKVYGDFLQRYLGRSRQLRTSVCNRLEIATADGASLDPATGLQILNEAILEYRQTLDPQEMISGKKKDIPGTELKKMEVVIDKLTAEIENGDALATSVGMTFNQFITWINANQELAFLGFRVADSFSANLPDRELITFTAGMVDLVAIALHPDSKLTAQEVEDHIAFIDNAKTRKSGISLQSIIELDWMQERLLTGEAVCRIVDYKQHSVAPSQQVIEAEEIQLTKYYVATFPYSCRKPGEGIILRGGIRNSHLARAIELTILDLRDDTYAEREIIVPERTAKLLTKDVLVSLYNERDALDGWRNAKKHVERANKAGNAAPLFESLLQEEEKIVEFDQRHIVPEKYTFAAILEWIRDRAEERRIYSQNIETDLSSQLVEVFEKLFVSGGISKEGKVAEAVISDVYERLKLATNYQQIAPQIERIRGINSKPGGKLSLVQKEVEEILVQYFEQLEKEYPELAYFRSVIESSAKTGTISYYDAILLTRHDINKMSQIERTLVRYPDGTLTVEVRLPNYPVVVTVVLPLNKNELYLYVSAAHDIYNRQLHKYGGPPYLPLKGLKKRQGKVYILQKDKSPLDEVNIDRLFKSFFECIRDEEYPFVLGKHLDRFSIDRLLHKIQEAFVTEGPQAEELQKLGIPKKLAINELGLRFTNANADTGTTDVLNLHIEKSDLLQLGIANLRKSTIWGGLKLLYLGNRTVFPVTDLAPVIDVELWKSVGLTGFAFQKFNVLQNIREAKIFRWNPPAIKEHQLGYFQIGDITTAKKLIVAGDMIDAATLYVMFKSFDFNLSSICIVAPVGISYGELAEDVKKIQLKYGNLSEGNIEVLPGKWSVNDLHRTFVRHGLEKLLQEKKVTVRFWDLVKEILTLNRSKLGIRPHFKTVNKLWRTILEQTGGKVTDSGIEWPTPEADAKAKAFMSELSGVML